jgi:hypothetical protein
MMIIVSVYIAVAISLLILIPFLRGLFPVLGIGTVGFLIIGFLAFISKLTTDMKIPSIGISEFFRKQGEKLSGRN